MNVVSPENLVRLMMQIQESSEPPDASLNEFCSRYLSATREIREAFFDLLLTRMEVPREAVEGPLREVLEATSVDPVDWTLLLTKLRRSLESPRVRAFRRFLNASGGLKLLLELRADVLAAQRTPGSRLAPIDEEIAYLFTSWFQHGFLYLQEITQDSSFRQIQFLKEHDMVHPMASLEEMGRRLGEDRRSFALYHRAMPEEPIVFIEAALTRRIPSSIHEILDDRGAAPEADPDTAIFYSINNAQNGLSGLGLGKLLIFQVVDAIRSHRPAIRTFATLSPITGFRRRYLEPILEGEDEPFKMKKSELLARFSPASQKRILARRPEGKGDFASELSSILSSPDWIRDEGLQKELARPLTAIAFFYLTEETDARGKPLNPVAGFHMGNGAKLSARNVHFAGNRTERGLLDSCGLMVSYVYSSHWLHELRRSARAMLPWRGLASS